MKRKIKNNLTFNLINLGCKVNLYESNIVQNELLRYGYQQSNSKLKADIFVINTCSVTNKADTKSLYFIRKTRKQNPNALIAVMGCFSQLNGEILKKENINIIIGNKHKNQLAQLIHNYQVNIFKVENIGLEKEFENSSLNHLENNTRAFIKIQDGCNYMCSYCIIPYARGRQRSKSHELIIEEISLLVKNGYKEIVLTGVNTAGYGENTEYKFIDLLKDINKINGNFRVRISSLEPFQITNEIIDLITSYPQRWCQQWHICLQSANNKTLKNMNRKYTFEDFFNLINYIRSKNNNAAITTDYIVGFPDETECDFNEACRNLIKLNLFDAHIFKYSIRKNTPAAIMKNQISELTKTKRSKIIDDIINKSKKDFLKKFISCKLSVLFEKPIKNENYGHSSEFIKVYVNSGINLKNQLLNVKIIKIYKDGLFGEII